jgi:hypothetical protein
VSAPINIRNLAPGTSEVLVNDAEAEIVDNPRDGMWLLARYIFSPRDVTLTGLEGMIFVQNAVAVGRAAGPQRESPIRLGRAETDRLV